MITKPKAKRFRIKRSGAPAPAGAAPGAAMPARPSSAGASAAPRGIGPMPVQGETAPGQQIARPRVSANTPATPRPAAAPGSGRPAADPVAPKRPEPPADRAPAMDGQVASAREAEADTDIDAIRREGLTGRQLRMARRVAQRHGLPATSDFDAVRLLRKAGIDPFQRSNMLELVVPKAGEPAGEVAKARQSEARTQLPQTVPARQTLPSTELGPAASREMEVMRMQQDLVRRRRRKMALLMARLSFYVLLPTLVAGWYFYVIATPMYATKSEFLILQADGGGAGGGMRGLLSGTQFATNQDAIAVQSYLQSKDAMLRLNDDIGFKSHFTQDWIDPITRLTPEPTNEEAYKTYQKNVKIGYDPTEGVVRMEVIAADPMVATEFARKLISYAEERVNQLTQQKRGDQMRDALIAFEKAEEERRLAQQELVDLQVQGSILDPEAVIMGIRGQINAAEIQLQEKELQLAALMDNSRPNQSRVDGVSADIRRLENQIEELNGRMTDVSQGENSLAQLSVRIQMAQADLVTRDLLLQSALQQVESTRTEANKQVRYLTVSVNPVPSEEPSYPRKFENTILAFLVFGGIYLLISLTASILREQVSQ
jgi:capsular polysaccharide transport system permease protein